MKKLLLAAGIITSLGMTSCIKDYTCTCKDSNGNTFDKQTYPRTGLTDARKQCKDRQSFWANTTVPSAQCTIL
ncbi:MAG: hypothetical protein JWN78_2917 [Bacteroidota bacterium]|nr:hypothetical protein [Bacteroidota bacterium]